MDGNGDYEVSGVGSGVKSVWEWRIHIEQWRGVMVDKLGNAFIHFYSMYGYNEKTCYGWNEGVVTNCTIWWGWRLGIG